MDFEADLMRELMFCLEQRQTSPRSTIIISLCDEASTIGRSIVEIEASLVGRLDPNYIDGPGGDVPGFFLFRKLTRKGSQFVKKTRDPREWERMKRHFEPRGPDNTW